MASEKDNLKALLRGFYDEAEADAVERDIRWADDAMADWPRPTPEPQLLARIKARVRGESLRRRRRRALVRALSSVAGVAVIAVAAYHVFRPAPGQAPVAGPLLPASTWAIEVESDARLEEISAELDELADSMKELQIDVSAPDSDGTIGRDVLDDEATMSLDDFWKG